MENPTKEFLQHVYKEARCGCETVCGITGRLQDDRMRTETAAQLETYAACAAKAEQLLRRKDFGDVTFAFRDRLSARMGVMIETAHMHSPTEYAELLERSFRESASRMQENVRAMAERGCDGDALALGARMIAYEKEEADKMRQMAADSR